MLRKQLEDTAAIAYQAGQFLKKNQAHAERLVMPGKDIVLREDVESERLILAGLATHFPGIRFLSEEAGGERNLKGLVAIVDPLDGTNNYFHNDFLFGVSIGIYKDGNFLLAVIYLPACDLMLSAANFAGHSWKVSIHSTLKDARIGIDIGTRRDHSLVVLRRLVEKTFLPMVQCCVTASAVWVATGRLDGYYHPQPTPFDVAAAGPIVEQAGGMVTDEKGNPWNPLSSSFVVSNGLIHQELIDLINE